jgi:hypothetical protein
MSDLKGYKKCKNGHYYDENLDRCPYCPSDDQKKGGNIHEAKTRIEMDDDNSVYDDSSSQTRPRNENTKIYGNRNGSDIDKTKVFGDGDFSTAGSTKSTHDVSRTIIIDDDEDDENDSFVETNKKYFTRKLTGWLISYTIEKQGIDFKLFEGRNTLGHLSTNNISIPNDKSISGHHLTILFRNGRFKLRDELSANGTFINGEEIETGVVYEIKDGDKIKVGNTTFIFKTPFPLDTN